MAESAVTRAGSAGTSAAVQLPRSWGVRAAGRREEVRLGPFEPLAAEEQAGLVTGDTTGQIAGADNAAAISG